MSGKVLSLLGLARRAGRLEIGFEAAAQAARQKRACLLLLSADVSAKTGKNMRYEGERAGIPTLCLRSPMDEIGRACGVKKIGAAAVTDPGFAQSLTRAAAAEEKEETSL